MRDKIKNGCTLPSILAGSVPKKCPPVHSCVSNAHQTFFSFPFLIMKCLFLSLPPFSILPYEWQKAHGVPIFFLLLWGDTGQLWLTKRSFRPIKNFVKHARWSCSYGDALLIFFIYGNICIYREFTWWQWKCKEWKKFWHVREITWWRNEKRKLLRAQNNAYVSFSYAFQPPNICGVLIVFQGQIVTLAALRISLFSAVSHGKMAFMWNFSLSTLITLNEREKKNRR